MTFASLLLCLFIFHAQRGDGKETKDPMSSLNWKKWSPDPVPVFSAKESLAKFKVAPGFKVELVASEPIVKDPVFVDWDDQGRMWVGELRTYMIDLDGSDERERKSRVMVLEDTNGDGKMVKSTTFVDDMPYACFARRQAVQSTSSGEAEFYGVVRASGAALGQQSLFRDLGVELDVCVCGPTRRQQ